MLRLRDEGRASLDDPLERPCPAPAGDLTVGELLSHTAGVQAESPGAWWERSPGATLADLGLQADGLLHLTGLGRPGRTSRFTDRGDGTWTGLDGYFAVEILRVTPDLLVVATFVLTRTAYDPAPPVPGGVDPAGRR